MIFPAAWPSLCEIVILLILVPVMERAVYPGLARCGISVPILGRVMLGMLLAAGSAGMGRHNVYIKYLPPLTIKHSGFSLRIVVAGEYCKVHVYCKRRLIMKE